MFCNSPPVCFYLLFLSIASICYPFWWPCECKFQIKLSLLPSFTRGVIGSHVDFHEMDFVSNGPWSVTEHHNNVGYILQTDFGAANWQSLFQWDKLQCRLLGFSPVVTPSLNFNQSGEPPSNACYDCYLNCEWVSPVSADELDLGVPMACQVGFGLLGWIVL